MSNKSPYARKSGKRSDTKASYLDFNKRRHAPGVKELLMHNKISPEEAVDLLERISPQPRARVDAGQICVEQAYKHRDIGAVSSWLGRASCNFTMAERTGNAFNADSVHGRILGETLPLHAIIITTGRLPKPKKARQIYGKVIDIAAQGADTYDELIGLKGTPSANTIAQLELSGLLAEVAVVGLMMRYGLNTQSNDQLEYFANFSRFSSDHANKKGSIWQKAWDVDGLTDYGDEELGWPYRIQVKYSDKAATYRPKIDTEETTTIIVKRDLRLTMCERIDATTIIKELAYVNSGHDTDNIFGTQLDARTEKLTEKLG